MQGVVGGDGGDGGDGCTMMDAKAPFSTCGGIGMIFSNILARHFSSGKLVCPLFVKSLEITVCLYLIPL